ncbi:MAG: DUF481 domain-containing protein [Bacteroidales bacterium]|nr:DUF481 domain-containing protein [Bacteroidales bacterium]
MKLHLLLVFLSLYISQVAFPQLVNVESKRMQDDTSAFAGTVASAFSYQQNNEATLLQTNNSLTMQARSKSRKSVFLLLANYDLKKTNAGNFSNAGFVHFRYTRHFNKYIRWEGFVQYQSNPVLLMDNRALIGTGPRVKIFNKSNVNLSLGALYMYELENTLEDIPQQYSDHRLSTYLAFNYVILDDKIEITTITYYQPLLNDFSDLRITNQTSISLGLTDNLDFEVGIKYLYDANPPVGVISNSFSTQMGLKFSF